MRSLGVGVSLPRVGFGTCLNLRVTEPGVVSQALYELVVAENARLTATVAQLLMRWT